jgi:alkylation response protein AidB-like acyl-CoA dehydrogenase
MSITQHDLRYYLDTAQELAARVAENSERIDRECQIPTELAAEMADKGFFRLLLPRRLGGAELDLPDFLRILEIFAAADGSTAWTLNQNNVWSTNSVRVSDQTAREIWSDQRAVVTNGPPTPSAVAVPVEGGYKLSGRWFFSSGSSHATWIGALAPVRPAGKEPTTGESLRVLLLPKSEVDFVPGTWEVSGLRGTASFGFEINDVFVPSDRTYEQNGEPIDDGPLYRIPRTLLFSSGFSTVALGIAGASLKVSIDLSSTRTQARARSLMQEQKTTQRLVGEAEAILRSARAFLQQSASSVWESAYKGETLTTEQRINLRLASTHGIRQAARVVDTAYELVGSGSIFPTNPIHRRFQDIHVITQHIQGRSTHYETAGQFFLGLEPEGNF